MLKSLNIENIAVIENADIEFSAGLNVLTGETGAGKSIIVDSINAVLGERTSKELVRHGATSASVTAVFDDINDIVISKLNDLGIDFDDEELIINRKISSLGKSSCRINGIPCTASMIKDIASTLVNIHGQHDSQALLNPDIHYMFVDMYGDENEHLENYSSSFKKLVTIRRRLKQLTADADSKDEEIALLDYQINELQNANIVVGERDELKKKKEIIINSKNIISSINATLSALNGDDDNSGVLSLLSSSKRELEQLSNFDKSTSKLNEDVDSIIDLTEILKDKLSSKLQSVEYSAEELEIIDDRLDMYYNLSRKYGSTEEEMLSFLDNAIARKNSIVNSDEEIEKLSLEYDEALKSTIAFADILSCYRKGIAYQLELDIKEQLEYLDMPKIKFVVDFDKGNLSSTGYDKIEFLISTNPGEPPKPLSKIASGGELSRIMLAIKNILAHKDNVDTLIFDEIDTGVSGRASRKIGLKLKSVSKHSQVLCVTHSAQIASVADNHLLIEKKFFEDRTYTNVKSLNFEERKKELARIMGGLEITDNLLKSAEELLKEI